MIKLSNELKTIPSWFEKFSKEKLYKNQIPVIRYLIWLMQLSCAFSIWNAMKLMLQMNAPAMMNLILISFVTILLTQITVLGIQAKSKLAWLLLVTFALSALCSMAFPVGLLMLVFLNQDEVIDYFKCLMIESHSVR